MEWGKILLFLKVYLPPPEHFFCSLGWIQAKQISPWKIRWMTSEIWKHFSFLSQIRRFKSHSCLRIFPFLFGKKTLQVWKVSPGNTYFSLQYLEGAFSINLSTNIDWAYKYWKESLWLQPSMYVNFMNEPFCDFFLSNGHVNMWVFWACK